MTIFPSLLFATISGSAAASAAAVGGMLIPAMERDGYKPEDAAVITAGAAILPPGREATMRAVAFFELEKVFYELAYELGNRPDWVGIPLTGALRLLDGLEELA